MTGAAAVGAAQTVSAGSLFLQLMVALAVVLAIIWVATRLLRGRVGTLSTKKRAAPLAILGRQPLGKGVAIAIVKAGAETLLVGVTSHQVTNLGPFRPEEVDLNAGPPSTDDLPPVNPLQTTIRQLQDRTVRRR